MRSLLILLSVLLSSSIYGQYWQQAVDYTIEVEMDHETAQYNGTETVVYTNNSPETLHKVFFHLYYNAFQPGSENGHTP